MSMRGFRISSLFVVLAVVFSSFAWPLSLNEAQSDYISGNHEEAIRKAKSLRETDKVLYFLGLVYTKLNNYSRARIYFRKLTSRFPTSSLYGLGLIKLADTYFLENNYSEADLLYKEINRRYPNLDAIPLVFLRLAQIASRQGNWQEKVRYLNLIKQRYPKSSEMKYVDLLEGYGNFFSVQVGAFSEKSNALSLVDKLSEIYEAYFLEDLKGSYPIYKVRIGKFRNRKDAERVSYELLDKGYPARIHP